MDGEEEVGRRCSRGGEGKWRASLWTGRQGMNQILVSILGSLQVDANLSRSIGTAFELPGIRGKKEGKGASHDSTANIMSLFQSMLMGGEVGFYTAHKLGDPVREVTYQICPLHPESTVLS